MKLKRLVLKNVRSYEDQEIIFPEGSLLLAGNVGSGKTTILLAIEYALFGLQAGQRGSALLRNTAESAEVALEFETDETIVLVERSLKKDSRSITSDYAAITVNGEKIECSTTELKSKILNILGYPEEFVKKNNTLYKYTVYTPQEQMKYIILEDPQTRFSILRHIFGIDKYKRIRENSTLVLNKIKEETKLLQSEASLIEKDKSLLENAKSRISQLDQHIILNQEQLIVKTSIRKDFEKELQALEDKRNEKMQFEKEVEKTRILISSKKDQLTTLEREEINLKRIVEESKPFDHALHASVSQLLIERKIALSELSNKLITLKANIQSLFSSKKETLTKKERVFAIDMCPTCLQNVSVVHKHNILNDTEKKIVEIKKTEESLDLERSQLEKITKQLESEIKDLEQQKSQLDIQKARLDYYQQASDRLDNIQKQKENFSKDIVLLTQHVDTLKESILKFSSFDSLYKRKSDQLKQAFVEEKQVEIKLAEVNKEIEILHHETIRLQKEISQKEQTKKKLTSLLELSSWLSTHFATMIDSIERQVMLKLRQEFSKFFNTWFAMIAGEGFEVQLDENFTPVIIQGGIEMDYSFLSGGERTAIALAYRLALNQTINTALSSIKTREIIILDEPTEGFSDAQIDKMRDIFEQLKVRQLIIVSHEQKIEGFVDHVLKVKKEGMVSQVHPSEIEIP